MTNIAKHHDSHTLWIPLFFVFMALLPVIILRDFSPANELRYLSIADEAISNGTYFTFYNHGVPYADKPPLYLWIVMAARLLFGNGCMWFLSLFSLIPAFVIVIVMDRWARGEIREEFRADAMLLTLTTGIFTSMAVFLRMDMLMTMWIVLALYTFFRSYKGEGDRTRQRVLFPVYIFLGIFTKGPMAILIPLVTTTVYLWENRRLREWGRCWGWLTWGILLLLCGGWFATVRAEGGEKYLDDLLFNQTVNRAIDSFHHKEPFWYYLKTMWYTFMPWAFLIIGTVVAGFLRKTRVRDDIDRFFLTAAVSTFVLLSFISSKIEVYLLPAYPFFCYLAAIYMSRYPASRWTKTAIALPAAVLALAGISLKAVSGMKGLSFLSGPLFIAAGAIISLSAAAALWLLLKKNRTGLAVRSIALGLLAAVFTAGLGLDSINDRIGYRKLSEAAVDESEKTGISDIYAYALVRGGNTEVFMKGHKLTTVERDDTLGVDTVTRGIVMTGKSGMRRLGEFPNRQIGSKWIVTIDKPGNMKGVGGRDL